MPPRSYMNTTNASWFDLLSVQSTNWVAQTFTAISNHKVTSVKVLIKRYASGGDNPGTIYAVIKAVNSSGSPTGPALASGTTNGNTLTKGDPGEWRTITMSSYTIKKNTMYALILYNTSGYDPFGWFVADGSPYSGGNALESVDGLPRVQVVHSI